MWKGELDNGLFPGGTILYGITLSIIINMKYYGVQHRTCISVNGTSADENPVVACSNPPRRGQRNFVKFISCGPHSLTSATLSRKLTGSLQH